MVTQALLHELFNYDKETGVFTRKIKTSCKTKVGDVVGYDNKNGYIKISVNNKLYFAHRMAWLYVYGALPETGIDHINRNPSDNSIKNLRLANQSENMQNISKNKRNSSGYKGVTLCKKTNKWVSQIMVNYKHISLGKHETPEIAYEAYLNAAKKYHTRNFILECNV
jgi:hypothetical protein